MAIWIGEILIVLFFIYSSKWTCFAATNFCLQPLGMERRIIGDAQITYSTTYSLNTNSGKEARLNNNRCWCSATNSQVNQWVKVDLEKPLRITGIAIQGDPLYTPNFITKFKLKYSVDGSNYFFTVDNTYFVKEYPGATTQNELITRSFETKPFPARFVEFRPTERNSGGNDLCGRFELYGCSYVCNKGLGLEYSLPIPPGFTLSASSAKTGNEALKGRLSDPSSWCANTNNANEYLQIDFGKIVTITGIATQGSPTVSSWVKDFYIDYGITESSLAIYSEKGVTKLFIGNKDKTTIAVNWFQVRLRAKYVRVKPISYNGDKCMRIEIIGCDSDFIAEVGAENRVLEDSRFSAYQSTQWVGGRYLPKDGRLNNDRPWGSSKINPGFWFKVDLGRIMLVNGIATQGDATYGSNFFPDYKLDFGFESTGTNVVGIKGESSSTEKVFSGNTNNMGVNFNFLKDSPFSTRFVQFLQNTAPQNDYTLKLEIYAQPQVCSSSFGMVAGESSAYEPTITVSAGTVPSTKAKINSASAWCAGSGGTGHHFMYDFGKNKQISGIAIQGDPSADKWVKTFKVQYGSVSSSLTTYSVGSTEKEFVGSKSRDIIVYNWFPTEITTRYIKIIPVTSKTELCLRLNVYGCPLSGCFERIGIESSTIIANPLLSSSTYMTGNEAQQGRFNAYTTWAACQFDSCGPKESSGSKPWIQLCLTTDHTFSSVIIQGHGDQDNLADVKTFSLQYSYTSSGSVYDYNYGNGIKIFQASTGRYGSKQIDFPVAVVGKCIRIKIESQTQSNQNVGMRWELLGCNSTTMLSVAVSSSSVTIPKSSKSTVTCSATGQQGGIMSFKIGGSTLVNSDIYNIGNQTRTSFDINGEIRRQIEITAKGSSIASSDASCSVTDQAQGLIQCQQTIQCSLVYADIAALGNSKNFTYTVTGLNGKPQAPTAVASSSITQTSAKITWAASTPGDFQVENYKVSIKKKSDGSSARPDQTVTALEATFNSLVAFTEYTIEVSAKSLTVNVYSPVGIHHFRTDEGAATAPVDVTATPLSDTMINLKWKQPISMNGILHQYQIKYKKSSDSSFLPAIDVGQNLLKTVDNLDPFTDYDFQITATTKLGAITGAWSSIVKEKTQEGFPLEPRALEVVSSQSWTAYLKWEKPSRENGIIRNYTINLFGSKSYNSTFQHSKSVVVPVTSAVHPLSVNVTDLVPGSIYRAQVAASTGRGLGNYSSSVTLKTLYVAPPAAVILKESQQNGGTNVILTPTWNIYGPITLYTLGVITGINRNCDTEFNKESFQPPRIPVTLKFIPGSETVSGINLKVNTIGNFTLCFRGVIVDQSKIINGNPGVTVIERKTLKTVEITQINKGKITDSQFVIPLVQGPSNSKFYQIIVVENAGSQSSLKTADSYKKENLGPYVASSYTPGTPYIAAEFASSSFATNFSVGDGKQYSRLKRRRRNTANNVYTNVALKPETSYSVFQRVFVTEDVYYSSTWIGPLKTKAKSTGGGGNGGGGGGTGKTPMIVGIVVAVAVVLVLSTMIVYVMRKKRSKSQNSNCPGKELKNLDSEIRMEPYTVSNDNDSYQNDYEEITNVETSKPAHEKHSIVRRRSSAASLRHREPPTEVRTDRHRPPVPVHDFPMHSRNMQKDNYHGLTVEYNNLKKGQLYSWDIAMSPANKSKNRCANIAAYDHSRVHLQPLPGQPDSDYFNANFISSYTRPSVYIASQGPVDGDESGFWRMIWDNNVPAIVMLTNVMERGVKKCAHYWPDGGEFLFGDITISLASMDNYVDYVIRSFSVSRTGHSNSRTLYHFHFLSWPNHGVPEFPTDLLNFRKKIRKYFPVETDQPILVHCSDGVGRTGTFIVIDAMLDLAGKQQKVDIFNYVNFIRTQRIQLVQVEEQYIFIHHALLEAITCGITEIETQDFRIKTGKLQEKDHNGKSGYQTQFERLNALTHKLLPVETTSALKPVNELRNRRNDVLPRDVYRVVLQQSIYENDSSDYINATYVDGYKRKEGFIATEHPLPDTISDFWTMVHQKKVATIVMLNKQRAASRTFPVFWPSTGCQARYADLFVSNQGETVERDFVRRIMNVSHRSLPHNVQDVEIFHFEHWPDHAVPKDTTRLLSLLNNVDKSQQQHGNKPIIVMCSDGAGRSGTLIAISNLLERFKTEQLIDVFQTIKKIRFFRPQFVENSIQYQFCFNMAQAYMDSFYSYANISS